MPEATTATRTSIDDIAASMLTTPDAAPEAQQDEDRKPDEAVEDEQIDDGNTDAEPEESEDSEGGEDATENSEDSDNGEDSGSFELTDDTVLAVTVDGQTQEVTLADLKKAYSGEGAIEKRLQEATLQRKAVETERQKVQQELQEGRDRLVQAFRSFDHLMFQPRVPKPDAQLQQANPQQYLLQMEQYRQDQDQLGQRRQQVHRALQQYEAQQAEELQQLKQQNAQKLVEVMPQLNDPEKGPELRNLILEGAQAYGFSQEEIGMAVDYRLFQMAADAAAYRRLKTGAAAKPQPQPQQSKTKVIRPGGQKAVTAATVSARQQQAAIQRAKQTGRPEDVAATMLVRKTR
jgi:hypothetical protein